MKIRKSEVFKSFSMYPAYWGECLKSARSQGFKYIDFNGMIFDTSKEQSPEFKNSICIREDLIDEDARNVEDEAYVYKKALEKIVTRSMSMYATQGDMLKDIMNIAWEGLGKLN